MAALQIEQVRNMLACNKHRLDDELEIQPDIMFRIAEQVTIMNGRMLEAKEELTRLEARLADDVKESEPRLSIDATAKKISRAPERIRAWQQYQEARTTYERWNYLLDCWRQKGYSLKTLSDLHAAQYFSVNSTLSPRQVARLDLQDEARAAMRRAHQAPEEEAAPARRRAIL